LENVGVEIERIDASTAQGKSYLLIRGRISKHLEFVHFGGVIYWIDNGLEADEFLTRIYISDHAIYSLEISSSDILSQTFQVEFQVVISGPVLILVAKIDPSPQMPVKSIPVP
jgi:hypothetical protein